MSEQNENTSAETESQNQAPSRPMAKFSGTGGINAAVWKNKSEGGAEHYSIRIDRTFRNNDGGLESTPYLREGDLLRAQKILSQVDDWIEQDKSKHRPRSHDGAVAGR
jgi:hypothetical protein